MYIPERFYTGISLFSGAGGLDIGIRQAGFDILACIEVDPHACDTLREAVLNENHSTQVLEQDIRTVDPLELKHSLLLEEGELDLLFGGSPCQSFSQMGKMGSMNDERGLLLFEFVRFAEALKPKVILIEQVKGILTAKDCHGERGGVLKLLISELSDRGYNSHFKVLNAANYGVPQLRERVFLVATLGGLPFEFPSETHCEPQQDNLFGLKPWQTLGDALRGLRPPTSKGDSQPKDSHFDITPRGDRIRITGVPEGQHLSNQFQLPAEQRGGLTKKDTTKFRRLAWSKPSLTLRCGETFYHPTEDRYLTPREYMRIHGYPDSYNLCGPIRGRTGTVKVLDQHRLVANSVPPPLGRIIGAAIIRNYLRCNISGTMEYATDI